MSLPSGPLRPTLFPLPVRYACSRLLTLGPADAQRLELRIPRRDGAGRGTVTDPDFR